jgi:hypothetical protein
VCPFPGAKCESTVCTCSNQPGGFYWDCKIEYCYCTCFCGKVAINSCEILGCSTAQDPCPASAAAVCEHICADGGVPDARPKDLQPETETGADQAVDIPIPDEGPSQDLPVPDLSIDTSSPDTIPPLDTSPE